VSIRWTARESFLAGYIPGSIGIAFNGVELLGLVDVRHDEALARRVDHLRAAHREQAIEVVGQILFTEALLRRVKVEPVASPRSPDDFGRWADRVLAVGAQVGEPEAFRAGFLAGDALLVLRLGLLVDEILTIAPSDPFFRAQRLALEGRLAAVVEALQGPLAPIFRAAKIGDPAETIAALVAQVGEHERELP
jgi:hypothetical protein